MREVRARGWPLLVLALSFVPVLGLFTTRKIFFIRDLSFFFWSRHLWLRHTIGGGEAPWWDPHVAGGQSAIADALNQLPMPVTLAIRLVPSPVVACQSVGRAPAAAGGARDILFRADASRRRPRRWSVRLALGTDRLDAQSAQLRCGGRVHAVGAVRAIVARTRVGRDVHDARGRLAQALRPVTCCRRRPGCRVCHLPWPERSRRPPETEATGSGTAEATGSVEVRKPRVRGVRKRRIGGVPWIGGVPVASAFGGR
jgi:hypothetical protein